MVRHRDPGQRYDRCAVHVLYNMYVYMYTHVCGRVGVFKPWTLDKRIHKRPRFRIRPRFQNVYKTYFRGLPKKLKYKQKRTIGMSAIP